MALYTMFKKNLILIVALLILSGCSSNSIKTPVEKYSAEGLHAKLEKINGEYIFTAFSFKDLESPWVLLNSPSSNFDKGTGECVLGWFKGSSEQFCEDRLKYVEFYKTTPVVGGNFARLLLGPVTLGFAWAGLDVKYELDVDELNDAFEEAISNSNITQEKTDALRKAKAQLSNFSSLHNLRSLQTMGANYGLVSPFVDKIINIKNRSYYKSYDDILDTYNTAVESITSNEGVIENLRVEINKQKERVHKEKIEHQRIAAEMQAEEEKLAAKKKLAQYKSHYKSLENSTHSYNRFINDYRHYDPLGYVKKAQLELEKIGDIETIQKRLVEAKRREALKNLIVSYRKNLSSGDDSHCGLVIEVKNKVVQVQTMGGPSWLKKEEIYPLGKAQCSFHNGVYHPPYGLPI
jgi:hypothetical protein